MGNVPVNMTPLVNTVSKKLDKTALSPGFGKYSEDMLAYKIGFKVGTEKSHTYFVFQDKWFALEQYTNNIMTKRIELYT